MKKLIAIILLSTLSIFLTSCVSTKLATEEELNHTFIIELQNLDKNTIYERSIKWIAQSFVSSKNVIDVKDKEGGLIVAKGFIGSVDYGGLINGNMYFTLNIDIKDGKARLKFIPTGTQIMNSTTGFDNAANNHVGAQKEFIRLKESYLKFLNTKDDF